MAHGCFWLLASLATVSLGAQTVGWVPTAPSSFPSARAAAGIAYDAATHATVLFGGAQGVTVLGDTWTWNGMWTPVASPTSPSPRQGPAMAYDGAANNVVLFGGSPTVPVGNGTADGDTWTWDGIQWTQQFPPLSPPARVWSSMVYDPPTHSVLLFGGTASSNQANCFSDTWEWNGVRKTWTELHPVTSPSGRTMNQLVSDQATGTIVLFGGVAAGLSDLEDTWTWNGVNWTQHFPAVNPGPRNGPALAYDPGLHAVVLFGGAVGPCCRFNLNDTWTWNGTNWAKIYPASSLPYPRNAANLVYDPVQHAVLLFGGASGGPVLDDTWLLRLVP